jgi:predicted acylesterase/phospholipase RssA
MRKRVARTLTLAAIAIAGTLLNGCASVERADRTMQDLMAARRDYDLQRMAELRALHETFIARVESKIKAAATAPKGTPQPTIDVLVISGGGDWGAFGAGVLKGWGRVRGELARPQFDVVTGVSTGALIAPFAFLGDDESIDRIVHLYRNPQKDVAVSRGMLFFLPNNPSFYTLPGLERELRTALDRSMIERIAAAAADNRTLLVNTTNIDLGDMRPWNIVAEARTALASNNEDHVHAILLASAGIPAVFPARGIGDYLFVDGAITGNILYAGRTREDESFPARWAERNPRVPLPRIRYWVIFNNQFRFPPQVTPERWPDIMGRATIMATQTSTMNSMRHLFALAEIARLKRNVEFEVRVMAVPDEWVPPKPGTFVAEVMNDLADLGERMGADPANWRTEPP